MTIAMCYVSPEGVVFGSDSTASTTVDPGGFHYFNHNQKLFEIGGNSTLGLVTWGLGGLGATSYRTLIADLADDLAANPPTSVQEVADRWAASFWARYSTDAQLIILRARCAQLATQLPFIAGVAIPVANSRTEVEEKEFNNLRMSLFAGFCIGGRIAPDRTPSAYELAFDPLNNQPTPIPLNVGSILFRGAPNVIFRLLFGCDDNFLMSIQTSPHWQGNLADLVAIRNQHTYSHPVLPIRDAIDFVYACIFSTIKAFKFSNHSQICGGPIEIAVVTTDRDFRWVRHKEWDSAIIEGDMI